jgi:phosphatidylserine/phosphatidylglycerophosphate/cardiolipin synthase-like enzyme
MGENRDRLIRRLAKADRHGRLRIYTPVVGAPDGECPILVHSKLLIIDDRLMRTGSSNLNNRSIGLDSELDISIEARDAEESAAIIALRECLLGEHLDVPPQRVADVYAETGSLIRTIERLNKSPRGLRPFEALSSKGPTRPVWGTGFLDPSRPFEPAWLRRWRRRRQAR